MMHGYGYGYNDRMMLGYQGDIIHMIFAIVILVDLILLGVWLWKQIQKK